MLIVVLVETVNLAVLSTNFTILDIIMNFLALVVLSEFDNFFFATVANSTVFGKALGDGEIQLLEDDHKLPLDDLLKIQVTTSRFANIKLPQHKLDRREENEVADPVAEASDAASFTSAQLSANDRNENPMHIPPEYIFIDFSDRPSFGNKVARVLYLILYSLFAAIWFYFIPFTSIYISYAIPAKYGGASTSLDAAVDA